MKILLFALAITICLANPTLRNLQSNESDSDVALSTGMTKALHAKVTHGSLPDSDWQILKISNLTKTNTTDGIVYNAIVDVTNNHDTELIANVSVLYQAEENRVEISAFNYQLIHNNETANETTVSNNSGSEPGATNTTEANPSNSTSTNSTNTTLPSNNTSADGYTQLDPSFVTNNGVAYGAVVYGVNAVVQNGINSTKIPNTSYTVTQVTSVSIKNITQGADYQVSASLVNADFVRMNVRCTVFYNKKTGSYKLLSYWYHAFNISDTVSTQPINTTAPTNSTSNSTSTSPANTSANNTTSEGYTILDVTQVQQSTAIQAALQSGISQLVQVGASQNKFPNTPYTVSELVSASYKNLAKSVSYKFFVKLVNVKYARIEANLTVNYNLVNGSYKLNGYNFRSSNYSIKDLPGNSSTSVNTDSNTGNSTGGSTNSTSTNTNSSGTTNSTGGSTINTNTSSSSTNTTINNTNSDGFTKIDVTQIAQNNQIQGALSFGVAALLQSGVNRNKIPNTPFNLASIGGASYKNQSNGINYKFSASLVSAKYAHVDANFIVFYRYSNQSYSIGNFSYSSYNYSNSDLLNATSNSGNNSNTASNTTRPANTTVTANSTSNASPANGTSSVNNTAGNSTYADGYVSLNVAQVLQNSTLTGFINQGAAWVIQKGVNDTKIPNTPFNLAQVNSFDERDTPKGDYYHVNAVMKNANNVTVTMTFLQYYKFPTQANTNGTLSVQSWTYSVATPRARN